MSKSKEVYNILKTIIMAGGKGTCISALFPDIPGITYRKNRYIPRRMYRKPLQKWAFLEILGQAIRNIGGG